MQPFGLFSLLQNLLENTSSTDNATPTAPSEESTPPSTPPVENVEHTENRQAILNFLTAHEQRARKTKKH